MNSTYNPLREVPTVCKYQPGDYLVVIGEIFQRGYANGLIEEAQKQGLNVLFTTVGRRDKEGQLRALEPSEISDSQNLINIPLEAGFDLEKDASGLSPVDQVKDVKLSQWENVQLNWKSIEDSKTKAQDRFQKNLHQVFLELDQRIPKNKNVLFAHIMAGGVPRAKIIMPLMNRVFKGQGERYLSSKTFWDSELGKLCALNFMEVTANTFQNLTQEVLRFSEVRKQAGAHISMTAYGYHGTEILTEDKYEWQTYAPYLQGWAKIKLEKLAAEAQEKGLPSCVYNCPEILTNSSSIFQGVEIPLYPLLKALQKESSKSDKTKKLFANCQEKLKPGVELSKLYEITKSFYTSSRYKGLSEFQEWPQHSTPDQLSQLLNKSDELIELHKDPKDLVTFPLSEVIFQCCGHIMLFDSWSPQHSSSWIGHELIAKIYPKLQ